MILPALPRARRRSRGCAHDIHVRGLALAGPGDSVVIVVVGRTPPAERTAGDGRIVTLSLPAGTPVVRNGRPASAAALRGGDVLHLAAGEPVLAADPWHR